MCLLRFRQKQSLCKLRDVHPCAPQQPLTMCRKLHNERQVLIRQWEDAMQAMGHRDKAIVLASEQVQDAEDVSP